jgi:hypothetical protein
MPLIRIAALIGFMSITFGAFAESISTGMKAFGVIGVWSKDCSVDLTQSCFPDLRRCVSRSG